MPQAKPSFIETSIYHSKAARLTCDEVIQSLGYVVVKQLQHLCYFIFAPGRDGLENDGDLREKITTFKSVALNVSIQSARREDSAVLCSRNMRQTFFASIAVNIL